jgi:gamma-glutamyltranspeptidase/glutathione hydrolase
VPRISVAAPSNVVTEAAVGMGDRGGSVVDVAIVAALAAMCTEPGVCGPGGGGFLAIDVPGRDPVVIDGYMAFPGKGFDGEPHLREVTMTYGGGVTTLVDAGSVAVPGVFAALGMASEMFGAAPWAELMEAVAVVVQDGFPLSAPCHLYLNDGAAPIYQSDPVARVALFDDGVSKPLGYPIVFPGLADTLRHIGEKGASEFYDGDLAETIVTDLLSRGGQLTMEDMRTYEAVARGPIASRLNDWTFDLNPLPAVGGVTVARVLEELVDAAPGDSSDIASALTTAFEARQAGSLKSPSTISISAADDEGGVVAASFSAGYGSGLIPAGTGMLMNNSLGELELSDGPGEPGERMVSNMAPTVARRGDDAVAVGSPGADRITTAVATTLARLAAGDGLRDAIDHPRAHPELGDWGARLAVEPGLDLDRIGLELRVFASQHMYFGGVNGAGLFDGELVAHADSRRTGSVGFTTP